MRLHSENECTKTLKPDNIDLFYLWMLEELLEELLPE